MRATGSRVKTQALVKGTSAAGPPQPPQGLPGKRPPQRTNHFACLLAFSPPCSVLLASPTAVAAAPTPNTPSVRTRPGPPEAGKGPDRGPACYPPSCMTSCHAVSGSFGRDRGSSVCCVLFLFPLFLTLDSVALVFVFFASFGCFVLVSSASLTVGWIGRVSPGWTDSQEHKMRIRRGPLSLVVPICRLRMSGLGRLVGTRVDAKKKRQ